MQTSSLLASDALGKKSAVAVVLAAGQGKRMCSETPKTAHQILGKPLIHWPLETLYQIGVDKIVVVLSPNQKIVGDLVSALGKKMNAHFEVAYQHDPKGTAHALQAAMPAVQDLLKKHKISPEHASLVVCMGDMPAVSATTYEAYLQTHLENKSQATVMAFDAQNPFGYGRVLVESCGKFIEIREHKDCTDEQRKVTLCNSGFLCVRADTAAELLPQIKNNNASSEFYLTDLPMLAKSKGNVGVYTVSDALELEGINSQQQLASVAKYMQQRIVKGWMEKGTQFLNPEQVYVEASVELATGVIVEPFVFLAGNTKFKTGDRVSASTRWVDGNLQKI